MKKRVIGVLLAVVVMSAGSMSVSAAGHCGRYADAGRGGACSYVDENGDGICDNCNFTDKNGDGICDNYSGTGCKGGQSTGGACKGGRNVKTGCGRRCGR